MVIGIGATFLRKNFDQSSLIKEISSHLEYKYLKKKNK